MDIPFSHGWYNTQPDVLTVELGPDGQTVYLRWKGRPFKRSLPPFGEMVEFLPAGKRQTSTIGDRWLAGIYFGVMEKSSELIIGFGEKGRESPLRQTSDDVRTI